MADARWADTYLSETPVKQWDVVDYLSHIDGVENFPADKILSSWVRALSAILVNDGDMDDRKHKAKKLHSNYTSPAGTDDTRARNWFQDRGNSPPMVITNSFTSSSRCSVNLNLLESSGNERYIPKRRKSSSRVGKPRKKKQKKSNGKTAESDDRLRERFASSYTAMDDGSKWKLPSGEVLEDVIYRNFKEEGQEHSAHSWVIDLDDPGLKACFSDTDWSHIGEQMPEWPAIDPLVGKSIMRFEEVQNPGDLATALEASYHLDDDEDEHMDPEAKRLKYLGPRWIDLVMRHLLPLYEDSAHFRSKFNLENWFVINIWSAFLDQCMRTVKDVHLSRGESKSMSQSDRKNVDPAKPGSRKKAGRRYDGILRFKDFEIGAVEHGKDYKGESGRKWMSDTLKLTKVLHDMLARMEPLIDSGEIFESVQVVGLVTAGLHCQPMRMKYAKGYACILQRHWRRELPTSLEDAGDLFDLLLDFWALRAVVQGCKQILEKLKSQKRKRFFAGVKGSSALPPRVPLLMPSIDTDGNETTEEEEEEDV